MSSTMIPSLRYRNAPEMIEWLCSAFGFSRHLVVEDGEGGIAHAQLKLGGGMLMLGSIRDDEFSRQQSTPGELHGNSQSAYILVADADVVYKTTMAQDAEIVIEIRDEDYGGRGFCCRDPEGYLWSVGSYDPWQES